MRLQVARCSRLAICALATLFLAAISTAAGQPYYACPSSNSCTNGGPPCGLDGNTYCCTSPSAVPSTCTFGTPVSCGCNDGSPCCLVGGPPAPAPGPAPAPAPAPAPSPVISPPSCPSSLKATHQCKTAAESVGTYVCTDNSAPTCTGNLEGNLVKCSCAGAQGNCCTASSANLSPAPPPAPAGSSTVHECSRHTSCNTCVSGTCAWCMQGSGSCLPAIDAIHGIASCETGFVQHEGNCPPPSTHEGGLGAGAIAGIVISVLAFAVAAAMGFVVLRRRRRNSDVELEAKH